MPVIGPSTPVFTFYPDSPPSVLGKLTTGKAVTIEVWKGDEAIVLPAGAEACEEVGDTGIYAFSTTHLLPMLRSREQYHYRMTTNEGQVDEGDFILEAEDINAMPSLAERDTYVCEI